MPDNITNTEASAGTVTNLLEFYNQNTHRAYPLVENASGVDTAGLILPTSFLVELSINLFGDTVEASAYNRFFISAVSRTASVVRVDISYQPEEGSAILCGRSADIPLSSAAYTQYVINPTIGSQDSYLNSFLSTLHGTLRVGLLSDISSTGSYSFTYSEAVPTTTINNTCVHIFNTAPGLQKVTIETADGTVDIEQDFIIRAGENVELSVLDAEDGRKVLLITAKQPSISELVAGITQSLGNPIRKINGLTPGSTGAFIISGKDCVEVANVTHGIVINNPCSKPCCDDADAEAVYNAIASMEQAKQQLLNYYQAVSTNINAMQARLSSIIAARGGTQ